MKKTKINKKDYNEYLEKIRIHLKTKNLFLENVTYKRSYDLNTATYQFLSVVATLAPKDSKTPHKVSIAETRHYIDQDDLNEILGVKVYL